MAEPKVINVLFKNRARVFYTSKNTRAQGTDKTRDSSFFGFNFKNYKE